jgi:muconolactone delta-isomerase
MRVLVMSKEPRPHGPWHTPLRHQGCLVHWVQWHMRRENVTIYPHMFVRGYVMVMDVDSGAQLRTILQGNPMWMDETYHVYILEDESPMKDAPLQELPVEPGKNRFLILVRPAKPLPPDLDYAGTDRMLAQIREQYGAHVYRLVEDVVGYAILINIDNNDMLRKVLEPLPITTYVNYQIIPLGTLERHKQHIADLGLNVPFEAPAKA